MSRKTVGVVDYGVGNHTSVQNTIRALGYRCHISSDYDFLRNADTLILPGVGAYPSAMAALEAHGLSEFLKGLAVDGKPLIGICLGMQLLGDLSVEHGITRGLGLIPGEVHPIKEGCWHIGWNSLELIKSDNLMSCSDNEIFYFNHSYYLKTPNKYCVATVRLVGQPQLPAAVRQGNICGLQFHPEKSQNAGRRLLKSLIDGLGGA